jgi:spermidine synthase
MPDAGQPTHGAVDAGERDRSTYALLLLCFFVSGLAALIYQTAWTRRFAFVFGTSELAVATVLAAYMAGLAVGAAVAARFVDRVRRPVLVYGVLEGAIALSALCVPLALDAADSLHAMLFATPGAPPGEGGLVTALFYLTAAFGVLLVPTGLMGATLPLLAREAIHRQRDVGPRIATLYAMNTTGAVAGTLLAGFWLLPTLGLQGTVLVAVAANALVFVAASVAGSRRAPQSVDAVATHGGVTVDTVGGPMHAWVLPVMLVSGAVSFSYEVLWTRLLGHVLGGSVHAFATMLASFLTGIALGSFWAARFSRTPVAAGRALFACQIGVGTLSLMAFFAMDGLPEIARGLDARGTSRLFADAAASMAVLLPSTIMLGATFPLAVRLLARDEHAASRASARVYAWNTVGAIFGAIGAGFFLIPGVGFSWAVSLAAATNFILAAVVAWRAPAARPAQPGRRRTVAVLLALAVAGGVLVVRPPTPWDLLRTAPIRLKTSAGELAFEAVGRSATVTVLRRMGAEHLATNGLPEAVIRAPGARAGQLRVAQWLGAGAGLARPEMRDMLVVGLGGGVLLERVPNFVERVDVVELEPEVVRANEAMAPRRAFDPLSDPRVHVVVNDARAALMLTDRRWDAIVSQPSHPWTAGASHLYTREFFELVESHLEPGGVFVQWMGLAFIDESLMTVLVTTLQDVFDYVSVHHPQPGGVIFFASNSPLDLERSAAIAIAADPDTYASMGLYDEVDVAANLFLDAEGARRLAERGEVSHDDWNLLQMRSPAIVRSGLRPLALDDLEFVRTSERVPHACSERSGPRAATARMVRRLVALGHLRRAQVCAARIADPSQQALARASIAEAVRDRDAWLSELERARRLAPDSTDARFAWLASRSSTLANDPAELEEWTSGLPAYEALVVEGWVLAGQRRYSALAELDPALADSTPADPAHWDAWRLRALWRVELGGELNALEAIALIDGVIDARVRTPEDLLLRARATLNAGLEPATMDTLLELASVNRGKERNIEVARAALDVVDRVSDGAFAEGERSELRRRLGARN